MMIIHDTLKYLLTTIIRKDKYLYTYGDSIFQVTRKFLNNADNSNVIHRYSTILNLVTKSFVSCWIEVTSCTHVSHRTEIIINIERNVSDL